MSFRHSLSSLASPGARGRRRPLPFQEVELHRHMLLTFHEDPYAILCQGVPDVPPEVATLFPEVPHFRAAYHKALVLSADTFVEHSVVETILDKPSPDKPREDALKEVLTECLDSDFNRFWALLQSLIRCGLHFNLEDPLDYLNRTQDIAMAFIRATQAHPDSARFSALIDSACPPGSHVPVTYFRGATVADPYPLFETFAHLCADPNVRIKVFQDTLWPAFESLCSQMSQEKQQGFPTGGVRTSWKTSLAALKETFPNAKVYTTCREYLPMLGKPPLFNLVEDEDPEEETNDDPPLLKLSSRFIQSIQKDAPYSPIVFMASVRRDGTRLPIARLMKEIKKVCPETMFAIDSAQDKLAYPDADIVFYSKLIGGSQNGLALVSTSNERLDCVRNALRIESTLSTESLALLVANLWCRQSSLHFANRLEDLTKTRTLWNFRGKGSFMDSEAAHIKQFVGENVHLNEHFEVSYSDDPQDEVDRELERKPWRSNRLVVLRRRPGSSLNIQTLAQRIEEKGIQVDWFSLEALYDFSSLMELGVRPYSAENARGLHQALTDFQAAHRTYIFESLLTPAFFNTTDPTSISETDYNAQISRIRAVASRHELLRVNLTILMNRPDVQRLLDVLNASVSELSGPSVSPPPTPIQTPPS